MNDRTHSASGVPHVDNLERFLALNLEKELKPVANSARLEPPRSPEPLTLLTGRKVGMEKGELFAGLKPPLDQKEDVQDWRQFFRSEKSVCPLQYFAPTRVNGKIIVKPPKEATDEGILKPVSCFGRSTVDGSRKITQDNGFFPHYARLQKGGFIGPSNIHRRLTYTPTHGWHRTF